MLAAFGCGPSVSTTSAAAEGTGSEVSTADATPEPPRPTPEGTSTTTATSTNTASNGTAPAPTDSSDEGGAPSSFLQPIDGGSDYGECDPFAQDCPAGRKCGWGGSNSDYPWERTFCQRLPERPGQSGDPCTFDGVAAVDPDSCDIGLVCFEVDFDAGTGTCRPLCDGSENNPVCASPDHSCSISSSGPAVCTLDCDPLVQDCSPPTTCQEYRFAFSCRPNYAGDAGLFGDPCSLDGECQPGLACIASPAVAGCEGASCCTPYCVVNDPPTCPGAGQTCVPLYPPGEAPPRYEHVGICVLP